MVHSPGEAAFYTAKLGFCTCLVSALSVNGGPLALIILEAGKHGKKKAYFWFGVQLVLNTLWSLVFFGFHLPELGVAVIIALIASIVMTIREFYPIKKYAAWLLVAYLAWVCFASYLTIGIALLNY